MVGAQKAKRKTDWVEVEIGIPESWWREHSGEMYRFRLAEAIEEGLKSVIALLQRNHHDIDAEALLRDWQQVRQQFRHFLRYTDARLVA